MFQICSIVFFFQLQKGSGKTKEIRRLSREEIEKQLIDSITNKDIIETEESQQCC